MSTEPCLPPSEHAICYFESEDQLASEIAAFLTDGFAQNQPALVVTHTRHRERIIGGLRARRVDAIGHFVKKSQRLSAVRALHGRLHEARPVPATSEGR